MRQGLISNHNHIKTFGSVICILYNDMDFMVAQCISQGCKADDIDLHASTSSISLDVWKY